MGKKVRKIILSDILNEDLADIYDYGIDTFGKDLAELFIGTIYQRIYELPLLYLLNPECRQLQTKTQLYRNIILGKYLIIYRVRASKIEVLRALHSSQNPQLIKSIRKIKLNK